MTIMFFNSDNFKYLKDKCVIERRKVTDALSNFKNTSIIFEPCLYDDVKRYIENEKSDLKVIPIKGIYCFPKTTHNFWMDGFVLK